MNIRRGRRRVRCSGGSERARWVAAACLLGRTRGHGLRVGIYTGGTLPSGHARRYSSCHLITDHESSSSHGHESRSHAIRIIRVMQPCHGHIITWHRDWHTFKLGFGSDSNTRSAVIKFPLELELPSQVECLAAAAVTIIQRPDPSRRPVGGPGCQGPQSPTDSLSPAEARHSETAWSPFVGWLAPARRQY